MQNKNTFLGLFLLVLGFGLGYLINSNGLMKSQEAKVIETKDISSPAFLLPSDYTFDEVKSVFTNMNSDPNREIYQCGDIVGFISVHYIDVPAWQGWLNAHECVWLASI